MCGGGGGDAGCYRSFFSRFLVFECVACCVCISVTSDLLTENSQKKRENATKSVQYSNHVGHAIESSFVQKNK